MSTTNAADVANTIEARRAQRIEERRAQQKATQGGSMKDLGGSSEYKASWDPNAAEGSMSASGTFDPNSSSAKEYYSLEEDAGSRVDDEEGWRQIKRESPPKTAAEYEAFAKKWSNAGFDVKAIDMDGDNFTHANIAIKPKEGGGKSEEDPGIAQSPELATAKAYTRANWDYRMSGDDMQSVTGYNPVTGEYGFNKANGQTAASTLNDRFKANLKYELNLKPMRPGNTGQKLVFKGGPDDQQDNQAVEPTK
jgi:hypothetical protein